MSRCTGSSAITGTPGGGWSCSAPTVPRSPAPPASCRTPRTTEPAHAETSEVRSRSCGTVGESWSSPRTSNCAAAPCATAATCSCSTGAGPTKETGARQVPVHRLPGRAWLPEPVVPGAAPRRRDREARTSCPRRRLTATGWSMPTTPRTTSTRCWPNGRPLRRYRRPELPAPPPRDLPGGAGVGHLVAARPGPHRQVHLRVRSRSAATKLT